jgi:hypothetical protein
MECNNPTKFWGWKGFSTTCSKSCSAIITNLKPDFKEVKSKCMKNLWMDKDYAAMQSESRTKSWLNPEIRESRSNGIKIAYMDSDIRDKLSKARIANWKDESYRTKVTLSRKSQDRLYASRNSWLTQNKLDTGILYLILESNDIESSSTFKIGITKASSLEDLANFKCRYLSAYGNKESKYLLLFGNKLDVANYEIELKRVNKGKEYFTIDRFNEVVNRIESLSSTKIS